MGRVRVFFGQREITQNCFVHFVGQAANAKHELALKDQGWVVAPLSPGMNFISRIGCPSVYGISLETSGFGFEVDSQGTTYFGQVVFTLGSTERDDTLLMDARRLVAGTPDPDLLVMPFIQAGIEVIDLAQSEVAAIEAAKHVSSSVRSELGIAAQRFASMYDQETTWFVSLAGNANAPSHIYKVLPQDDVLFTGGVFERGYLMWLGRVPPGEPWLGMRLQRVSDSETMEKGCHELTLGLDGATHHLPVIYRAKRDNVGLRETLRAEIDATTFHALSQASNVSLQTCGVKRRLPASLLKAAQQLLVVYDSERAKAASVAEVAQSASAVTVERQP
jgi:hypothetical protein